MTVLEVRTLQQTLSDTRLLVPLKDTAVQCFTSEHWLELGAMTNCLDLVRNHPRLLRSLSWGDPDYSGNALDVLVQMTSRDPTNLGVIGRYVATKFKPGENVSTSGATERTIVFAPTVFKTPDRRVDPRLVGVLMPFGAAFDPVYRAIQGACAAAGLTCRRADDIWDQSEVIQDIFALIFEASIVVADFTGRNPNVFYEVGIAHTLGKHVVPITQSKQDVPFDVQHHRYLQYLNNEEGRSALSEGLWPRLAQLTSSVAS
jgi:hypothetical protein